jgi:hypothetical protein
MRLGVGEQPVGRVGRCDAEDAAMGFPAGSGITDCMDGGPGGAHNLGRRSGLVFGFDRHADGGAAVGEGCAIGLPPESSRCSG